MNILLSESGLDLDEFYTISSYEKFAELTDEDFRMVHQIRIDDFKLGFNCVFNLADRPKKILNSISFVLNVLNPVDLLCLQYFIRKYKRVYQHEMELKAQHRFRSAYERRSEDG